MDYGWLAIPTSNKNLEDDRTWFRMHRLLEPTEADPGLNDQFGFKISTTSTLREYSTWSFARAMSTRRKQGPESEKKRFKVDQSANNWKSITAQAIKRSG